MTALARLCVRVHHAGQRVICRLPALPHSLWAGGRA